MTTRRQRRAAWLQALWGAAFGLGFSLGCSDGAPASSQILTGRIDTTHARGVVAIRAVSDGEVTSASAVANDGSFRIGLPAGARYRLEVLTAGNVVKPLLHVDGGWKTLEVQVCAPSAPFDLGTVGNANEMCDPTSDPNTQPGCGGTMPPPPCTDPMDPDCKPDPCSTSPMDPNCQPPPPPCGGMNEPACPPDPCSTNPMDPNCKPEPPPGCDPMNPTDPSCGGGTDPDPTCEDPMDPTTCKDPCTIDPSSCGCTAMEPNCWPPPGPPPCTDPSTPSMPPGMCDPAAGMSPSHVPGNFGCEGAP